MASVVPYTGVPTVGPSLAPTPSGHNQPPPGAFGGLTAVATEHLGQAISQAGNEVFERANAMQLLDQQAAADSGSSQFQMASAKRHADFASLQGKDAVDGLQPMLDGVEQDRQKIRDGLTSPYAQMQFDRDTRRMQGSMMISAASHAATQQKSYLTGSIQAKVDTAANTALSLPQDDTAYQNSLADIDKQADNMASLHGFSPEQKDNWAATQKSTLTQNRIEGIAKTDPFTAERMLDKAIADKNIIGQDIARVTQKVYYAQNTIGARVYAGRILSGEGSVAGGGPVPLNQASTTVGQYLSKDNYDLIGRAHDGSGQALGRYGVPTEKLNDWLKEANMPPMEPGDFLKSHSAQDQLFNTRFGKLQDDTGNFNDALRKWTGQEITPVGPGTGEQKTAFSFLKGRGWSEDAAHAMVATLSGESGSHLNTMANQQAGGRRWEDRFESGVPGNGIANWDSTRSQALESFAKGQGLNPNDLMTQLKFVDSEAREMGINPSETGDPRALTIKYTGSTSSGQGYEKPAVNNGSQRWAQYSGQRYANDPTTQQANGLLARNTPLDDLVEKGRTQASSVAPNNPLFADYLQDRIQGLYRQQVQRQTLEENQNKQVLEGALLPGPDGKIPSSIEELREKPEVAAAFDHASPQEQNRIQKVLAKNLTEGGIDFTPETFRQYYNLHAAAIDRTATPQDRQALLDVNVSDLNIPIKFRQQLFKDQIAVTKAEEASPQMARALRVLQPVLNPLGLTKGLDPDNYNSFIGQLHDAIQEHNRDSAKPVTDDDIKTIGTQLLRDAPQGGFWEHITGAQKWYQLPVPAKYSDDAKSDPRWKKLGVEPTDDMIRSMFVQQQFQQFYSKQVGQK